ncbi:MAG: patatin-like phospholipase family protein [Chloroflexota bacterium]
MSEDKKLFADAVFEGGGVKGIGLVGAVSWAEELGYRWMNVAGTSAGAIVAALIAAGYRAAEMKEILDNLDYTNFKDTGLIDRFPVIGPLASLIFEKGIYEGDFFYQWMRDLLNQKGIRTFGDLVLTEYQDDPCYRYKLRVIASDICQGRMLVLPQDIADYGTDPDKLDVALAIRMSMSIPFFYEPVRLRHKKTGEVSYIVDGGLLSNFPVWLFDTDGGAPEWPTLGFKLIEPGGETPHQVFGPVSLLAALFATMMEAHDARYIKDEQFVRTIPIPTLGVGTTEFDLSRERSEALYQSGREAAEKFFARWDFASYVTKFRGVTSAPSRGERLAQRDGINGGRLD